MDQILNTPYHKNSLLHQAITHNRNNWNLNPSTQYGYASLLVPNRNLVDLTINNENSPVHQDTRRNLMTEFDPSMNQMMQQAPTQNLRTVQPNSDRVNQQVYQQLDVLLERQRMEQDRMQNEWDNEQLQYANEARQQAHQDLVRQRRSDLHYLWERLLNGIEDDSHRYIIANWLVENGFHPDILMEFNWTDLNVEVVQHIQDEDGYFMSNSLIMLATNTLINNLCEYKRECQKNAVPLVIQPQRSSDMEQRKNQSDKKKHERDKRLNELAKHHQAPNITAQFAVDDTIAFETFCNVHNVEEELKVELFARLTEDVKLANAIMVLLQTISERPDLNNWAQKRIAIVATIMGLSEDTLDIPMKNLHLRGPRENCTEFEAKFLLTASIKYHKTMLIGNYTDLLHYELAGLVNLIKEFKEKMPMLIQKDIDQMVVLEHGLDRQPILQNVLAQVRRLHNLQVNDSYANFERREFRDEKSF
jgi:hypothetical protein